MDNQRPWEVYVLLQYAHFLQDRNIFQSGSDGRKICGGEHPVIVEIEEQDQSLPEAPPNEACRILGTTEQKTILL